MMLQNKVVALKVVIYRKNLNIYSRNKGFVSKRYNGFL